MATVAVTIWQCESIEIAIKHLMRTLFLDAFDG